MSLSDHHPMVIMECHPVVIVVSCCSLSLRIVIFFGDSWPILIIIRWWSSSHGECRPMVIIVLWWLSFCDYCWLVWLLAYCDYRSIMIVDTWQLLAYSITSLKWKRILDIYKDWKRSNLKQTLNKFEGFKEFRCTQTLSVGGRQKF